MEGNPIGIFGFYLFTGNLSCWSWYGVGYGYGYGVLGNKILGYYTFRYSCVCVCVCVYIYICIYMYTCIHIYVCKKHLKYTKLQIHLIYHIILYFIIIMTFDL